MRLQERAHVVAELGQALVLLAGRADHDALADVLVLQGRLALTQLLDPLGIEAAAPQQRSTLHAPMANASARSSSGSQR